MVFEWEDFFIKLDKEDQLGDILWNLNEYLLIILDPNDFNQLTEEIQFKTHYLNEEERLYYQIFKSALMILSKEYLSFTEDIHLSTLKQQLNNEYRLKTNDIILKTQLDTKSKDLLLENLEQQYKVELKTLENNYPTICKDWLNNHKLEVLKFSLTRQRLENWFNKFSFSKVNP